MATIRVVVMAVADPSMRNVFGTLEQSATRAYGKVSGGAKRSAKESTEAIKAGLKDQANAAGSAYRQSARVHDDDVKAVAKAEAAKTREVQRNEAIRRGIRDNTFRKMQADDETAARRAGSRNREFGRGVINGAGKSARAVLGGVGDAARGAGINFDIGSLVQNHLRLEEMVTKATNQGAMAKGKAATPAQIADSMKAVRDAATKNNVSFVDAAAGFDSFLAKFSDLDTATGVLDDLLKISNATGASIEDLGAGAGAIAANIEEGDPVKKLKMVQDALRLMTVMTTRGTVEMKDLAQYMPRLAATANKFGSDYQKNIGQLSTVAQMAMKGGRSSAAEATNTAQALPRDLVKGPMIKRLQAVGIDPFSGSWIQQAVGEVRHLTGTGGKAKNTELRELKDIVGDVYDATGGDQAKVSDLFKNEHSRSGILSFSEVYKNEGRKGIDRVFKEMAEMGDPGMIDAAAENTRNTKGGKARGLSNQLQDFAGKAIDKAVENPEATMGIMGAGILGGGLLGGLMSGGGMLGGGAAGGIGGLLGGGGGGPIPVTVVAIAAAAALAWKYGTEAIDEEIAGKQKKEAADIAEKNTIAELRTNSITAQDPTVRDAAKAELEKRLGANKAEQDALLAKREASGGSFFEDEDFREYKRLNENEKDLKNAQRATQTGGIGLDYLLNIPQAINKALGGGQADTSAAGLAGGVVKAATGAEPMTAAAKMLADAGAVLKEAASELGKSGGKMDGSGRTGFLGQFGF